MRANERAARGLPPEALDALCCPLCRAPLDSAGSAVRCPAGHSFDVARQGYVNLLRGDMRASTADTAAMVAARGEFLGAGHYAGIAEVLARRAAPHAGGGLVVDAGGGTGYYLRAVLDAAPGATGLVLDLSAVALRRAARAHRRAGAVVWDLWAPWPVRTAAACVVLNVFAPRNAEEFRRVLRPDGALLVVTPTPRHLAEIVEVAGLLTVDPDKEARLAASLAGAFRLEHREAYLETLILSPRDVANVREMGPSAHHHADGPGVPAASEPVRTTASVVLSTYRPR